MPLQRYNHTLYLFVTGAVNVANMKVLLLSDDAEFDPTDTAVNDVTNTGAWEVSGNGWDSGGEALSGVAWSVVNSADVMLDGNDLSVTATGGKIGPAAAVLLAVGTYPLFYQEFDSPEEAGIGTPFLISINASGIVRILEA